MRTYRLAALIDILRRDHRKAFREAIFEDQPGELALVDAVLALEADSLPNPCKLVESESMLNQVLKLTLVL